jgi:hypothetical protein
LPAGPTEHQVIALAAGHHDTEGAS